MIYDRHRSSLDYLTLFSFFITPHIWFHLLFRSCVCVKQHSANRSKHYKKDLTKYISRSRPARSAEFDIHNQNVIIKQKAVLAYTQQMSSAVTIMTFVSSTILLHLSFSSISYQTGLGTVCRYVCWKLWSVRHLFMMTSVGATMTETTAFYLLCLFYTHSVSTISFILITISSL